MKGNIQGFVWYCPMLPWHRGGWLEGNVVPGLDLLNGMGWKWEEIATGGGFCRKGYLDMLQPALTDSQSRSQVGN